MNLLQASIGHKIAAHFKRERRLMHRSFSVDLFNHDQNTFVDDLVKIFKHRDIQFDEAAFRKICFNED